MTKSKFCPRSGAVALGAAVVFGAAVACIPSAARAQERIQAERPPAEAAPADTGAQGPRVGPPIQRIATASAVSTEMLGAITSVRELPDGRVLVNDGTRRRLLLMDTMLVTTEVVLDSLSTVMNTYGTRAGALIPYPGDTTLFVDPASLSMLVIDPQGKVARVRSVWRAQDVFSLTSGGGMFGQPGIGPGERIVYRVPAVPERGFSFQTSGVPYIPPDPDSAFIVSVDLSTRRLDTLGVIRIPKTEMRIRSTGGQGGFTIDQVVNPLPMTDDWAVLPDRRVAFVRGTDYRIDYLNPDGTWSSSQKLPFEWTRLLDEDKQRLVDSVRIAQQKVAAMQYITQVIRWVNMFNGTYPENFGVPEGYTLPPGIPRDWILPPGLKFPENYAYACAPGETPGSAPGGAPGMQVMTMTGGMTMGTPAGTTRGEATAAMPAGGAPAPGGAPGAAGPAGKPACTPAPVMMGGGQAPPPPEVRPVVVIDAEQLPDYKPPFSTNSVRADADGNLWIRTNPPKPVPGGQVYDIVSSEGQLVNRIQLPPAYTLVGFGKGKIVYLSMRDATGIHLARVRLR